MPSIQYIRRAAKPFPAPFTIFVNYDTPDGGLGSIRVDDGNIAPAVAQARANGTNIFIRRIDIATGRCVERQRVPT